MDKSDQQIIWKFIRGDLPTAEFENWLYDNSEFEYASGEEFYVEIVSTNFKAGPDVYVLKKKLEEFMRQKFPLNYECIALPNLAVTDLWSEQEDRI